MPRPNPVPYEVAINKYSKEGVSICIPTYNGSRYIGHAITSVLNQTLTDFELIIVDDCSRDNSETLIKSFNDRRIKYHKNPRRLGLVGNWNKCVELSNGKYVCIFHQDDIMMPENIEQKVNILRENPKVGMVHSNVSQISSKDELISEYWYFKPDPKQNGVHVGSEFLKDLLFGPNIVCCPSAVVRRECYDKLGRFDPSLPFTADLEMWMRIALFYDIFYLVKTLVKYRRHADMETNKFIGVKDLEHSYRAKILFLSEYTELISNHDNLKNKLAQYYMQQAFDQALYYNDQGKYFDAKKYLSFALKILDTTIENTSTDEYADIILSVINKNLPGVPQQHKDLFTSAFESRGEKHQDQAYPELKLTIYDSRSCSIMLNFERKLIEFFFPSGTNRRKIIHQIFNVGSALKRKIIR